MAMNCLAEFLAEPSAFDVSISDGKLETVFKEIFRVLTDQQKQIDDLKEQLKSKASVSDLTQLEEKESRDKQDVIAKIPDVNQRVDELIEIIQIKNDELKTSVEESVNNEIINFQTTINQQIKEIKNDVQASSYAVQKIKASASTTIAPPVDLSGIMKRLDKLEVKQSPQIDMTQLNEMKDEFRQEIESLHSKMETPKRPPSPPPRPSLPSLPSGIEPIEEINVDIPEQTKQELQVINYKLNDTTNQLVSRIERKADQVLLERMFEKFRVLLAKTNDDITAINQKLDQCALRTEVQGFFHSAIQPYIDELEGKSKKRTLPSIYIS